MKKEYDFSKAERGKFFDPKAAFNVPVYLDEESMHFVRAIASKKNLDLTNDGTDKR